MTYKAFFDRKRSFGLELEFFGCGNFELQHSLAEWGVKSKITLYENPKVDYWTITTDNSIEGENAVELKSPILAGDSGLAEVRKVLTLLNYLEVQTNASCGLHIHHHVEDFTGKNVLALLRLYSKFEAVIDGLVTLDRREDRNPHCRSLVQGGDLSWVDKLSSKNNGLALQVALQFDKNYRVKNIGGMDALGSRNHKVNITSYYKYGTIEFRHFQGTTDIDDCLNWLVFTQLLINKAKHASVSKEMSARPEVGEFLRVLGLADYQNCSDPLAIETRTWIKNKYSNVRKKKVSHAGTVKSREGREGSRVLLQPQR